MTGLTIVLTLLALVSVLARRPFVTVLALSGATPAGAALIAGSLAVPTFYAAALGAVVALAYGVASRSHAASAQRWPPGAALVIAFAGWSIMVTFVAPFLFDGLPIVAPGAPSLAAGQLSTSNIAQIVYLVLGLAVMTYVARSPHSRVGLIGLAAGTCTALSMWRYLHLNAGLPFPENFFDNSPRFVYIQTAAGGAERFRGILSEPAGLAGTSLATMGYMLPRSLQLHGWHRTGALALAGCAVFLGLVSTSTTFVVAGVILVAAMMSSGTIGFLTRRYAPSSLIGIGIAVALAVAAFVVPPLIGLLRATIDAKVGTDSYTARSSTNTDTLGVFLDSWGWGVGLGSARASSFIPTLLAATGVVGTLLLGATLFYLVRHTFADRGARPVLWTLAALLIGKVVAGPDLSDSTGIFWLCLGLLSRSILVRDGVAAERPTADVEPALPPVAGQETGRSLRLRAGEPT